MNLDNMKNLIEFKRDYNYIVKMQWKFNIIKYYRNIIVLMDTDKVETNVETIVNEVRKLGYELRNITDYSSLFKALTSLLALINKEVNEYLVKNVLDKTLEKSIKDTFRVS